MNFLKKHLLMLAIVATCSKTYSDHGGAFFGGAALGLTTGMIAGSAMNRGPQDPTAGAKRNTSAQIVKLQKQRTLLGRKLARKKITGADYNQQIAEINKQIEMLQEDLQDLA